MDSHLKEKIERGEFVELERLLPKRGCGSKVEEGRLEWITRDGLTFLAPAQDKENKISNVRRWDQAFRVYAAIYCNANPNRSGEIWQYIHTIHTAASSYQWDNVNHYDVVFRQLMADRPYCSWSKMYAQHWSLALRDPLVKGSGGSQQSDSSRNTPQSKVKTWRDRCCWHYNRTGSCTKKNCHFDNCCSLCGAWNHGSYTCKKKDNGGSGKQGGSGGSSGGATHRK